MGHRSLPISLKIKPFNPFVRVFGLYGFNKLRLPKIASGGSPSISSHLNPFRKKERF